MSLRRLLNNEVVRDEFVARALQSLAAGGSILDAGAGSQRYRALCTHLRYVAQDFCKVTLDEKQGFTALIENYRYGKTDLVCDIVAIPAPSNEFDTILCTEVLEHVPDPVAALEELARVLKDGGTLILTVPSNCLRHFDPYFYFSGFSDQFLRHWCKKCGLDILTIETVGNYWSWLMVEVARSIKKAPWSAPLLLPAFAFYFIRSRFRDLAAEATLCMGYHVIARKR